MHDHFPAMFFVREMIFGIRRALVLCVLLTLCRMRAEPTVAPRAAVAAESQDSLQSAIEENLQTARWMSDYDRVAWSTTDLLLKESPEALQHVGPIWLCLRNADQWYAVYGRVNSGRYEIALCYREVASGKFEKVTAPEFADLNRFVRAINLTLPEIEHITRSTTVRFNYYIRAESDRIALYYVPAFQTDGKLAHGIQHTFFLGAAGQEVLSHVSHGTVLRGVIPAKNQIVIMDLTDCAVPTPQALFIMMNFRDRFADIMTHCQSGFYKVDAHDGFFSCVRTTAPRPSHEEVTSAGSQ